MPDITRQSIVDCVVMPFHLDVEGRASGIIITSYHTDYTTTNPKGKRKPVPTELHLPTHRGHFMSPGRGVLVRLLGEQAVRDLEERNIHRISDGKADKLKRTLRSMLA